MFFVSSSFYGLLGQHFVLILAILLGSSVGLLIDRSFRADHSTETWVIGFFQLFRCNLSFFQLIIGFLLSLLQ